MKAPTALKRVSAQEVEEVQAPETSPPVRKRLPRSVLVGGGLAVLAGLYFAWDWWREARVYVTTENAYVQADVTPLSARIGGTVAAVLVDDNDAVRKGDVLLRLDVADLEVALQAAQARLAQAGTQVEIYRAAIRQARAAVTMATAEAERARADLKRTTDLAAQQVVSRQALDHGRTAYRVAESQRIAAMRALESALSSLNGNPDLPAESQFLVQEAQAAVDRVRLDLSYAIVRAPADGYISQKRAEVGQRIQPGQPIMALVGLDEPYVVANFKETEITHIRIGQKADVRVDVYPDVTLSGRVDGIDSGTGATFSLLPPQNASGNWVKVVQRVPVKIVLSKAGADTLPLRVGFSAEVSVNAADRSGPLLRAYRSEPAAADSAQGLALSRP